MIIPGALSVAAYVALLVVFALDPDVVPARLASSPAGVAAGKVPPLLTSGLVVDGPAWPQITALAAVLGLAIRRLGAIRTWGIALAAHVGATLVAYVGIWLLWLTDSDLVGRVTHAPDYGISVVLAGELGALIQMTRPGLVVPGLGVLIAAIAVPVCIAGTLDATGLAGVEHLLGFIAGVATGTRLASSQSERVAEPAGLPDPRRAPRRVPSKHRFR